MGMTSARPERVAAVIGDPARHSRSPAIHNAAFAAAGIDWVFTAFEVPAGGGAAALEAMRVLQLAGLSVTMPLKAEVAEAADLRDDEVEVLGAANCIVPLDDGRLRAANTDAAGFIAGLNADAGLEPEGLRVVLLGAGGAARAVAWGLAAAGAAEVAVINRTPSKARAAADIANATGEAGQPCRVGSLDGIAAADMVVNATSVGMGADAAHPGRSAMPCDPTLLRPGQVAVDLVYEPLETAWLAALRRRGVEAHNGLSMLAYQAAAAFELWTGIEAPVDVMRQAATAGRTG
ncbi:MAG: shikimate dehydrogenase [Acidimicrobiaceae bacterium]|nr:shikimate dehydrogenase [Acidimicrobiaceae bacterium]